MARSRDISKVLSSNTTLATDAEVAASYQTKATAGLTLLTPTSIANTSGTASIGASGTITFSAVSTVSLNDVFSTTYQNYLIKINFTKATSGDLNMRLRASGTDATGASDYGQHGYQGASNADTVTGTSANTSSWGIGAATNTIETSSVIVWLFSPQNASRRTLFQSFCAYYDNTNFQNVKRAGGHKQVAGYDGFSLIQTSGTITGEVSVYGYNK